MLNSMLIPIKERGVSIVSYNTVKQFKNCGYDKWVEIKNCVKFAKYSYEHSENDIDFDMYDIVEFRYEENTNDWVFKCSSEDLYFDENGYIFPIERGATFITGEILKLINDTITELKNNVI